MRHYPQLIGRRVRLVTQSGQLRRETLCEPRQRPSHPDTRRITHDRLPLQRSLDVPLDDAALDPIAELAGTLESGARAQLADEEIADDRVQVRHRVHLRYAGTDTSLAIDHGSLAEMVARFEAAYRRQFFFLMPGKPIVAEAVSVEATGLAEPLELPALTATSHGLAPLASVPVYGGAGGGMLRCTGAKTRGPVTASTARRSSWRMAPRPWSRMAGAAR